MANLTFRNSRIVYYGPHECSNCGISIAKMGDEWGGTAFTYPDTPVYPNTEWHPHVCDPFEVRQNAGRKARDRQLKVWTAAHPIKIKGIGYVITSGPIVEDFNVFDKSKYIRIISPHCTFYDTELAAWSGAQERQDKNYPTWWIDPETGHSQPILQSQ